MQENGNCTDPSQVKYGFTFQNSTGNIIYDTTTTPVDINTVAADINTYSASLVSGGLYGCYVVRIFATICDGTGIATIKGNDIKYTFMPFVDAQGNPTTLSNGFAYDIYSPYDNAFLGSGIVGQSGTGGVIDLLNNDPAKPATTTFYWDYNGIGIGSVDTTDMACQNLSVQATPSIVPAVKITNFMPNGDIGFDTTGCNGSPADYEVKICIGSNCLVAMPLGTIGANTVDASSLPQANGDAITVTVCQVGLPSNCAIDTKIIPSPQETESIVGDILTWTVFNGAPDTGHDEWLHTETNKPFLIEDSTGVNAAINFAVGWTDGTAYNLLSGTVPAFVTITPQGQPNGACVISIDLAAAAAAGYDTFSNNIYMNNVYSSVQVSAITNPTEDYYQNYQVAYLVDTDEGITVCNSGVLDFNVFNTIDLSAYGGSSTTYVASNSDIVNAFAALGITAAVVGCSIHLIDYTGTVSDIEVRQMVFKFSGIAAGEQNMNLATPFQVRASVVELGNFGANQITSLVGSVEIFNTAGGLLYSNYAMPFDNNWQDTIPLINLSYRVLYKVNLPTGETCEFNTWVTKNSVGSSYSITAAYYNAITDNISVSVTGATVTFNAANSGEIDYKNDGINEIIGAAVLAPFSIMPADLSAGGSHELKATWHRAIDPVYINANPCHKIDIASYN